MLAGGQEAEATPWPSFELNVPEGPTSIGDFTEDERELPPRADPKQPARAEALLKPTPTPKPRPQVQGGGGGAGGGGGGGGDSARRGTATWYCKPGVSACHYRSSGGMYAAAGSELRVGNWRGRQVRVCQGGQCIRVTLIDWCACGGNRIIDLYSDAFRRLAPLSEGTISVRVSW